MRSFKVIPALSAWDVARFNKKVPLQPDDGCWLWVGEKHSGTGHGLFYIGQDTYTAYRVAYCIAYGAIPEGGTIEQTCEQPSCVRPSHLRFIRDRSEAERKAMKKASQERYTAKPEARARAAERKRQYDLTNQSLHREHHLTKTYRLTLEDWERLYNSQGRVCAICGDDKPRMTVDHDHESGQVRGILCCTCNLRLAILEDKALLAKALMYLKSRPRLLEDADPGRC